MKMMRRTSAWSNGKAQRRKMLRATALATAISALPLTVCHGQLTLNIGSFNLQPNTSGQVVEIDITSPGGINVSGLTLQLQVGDGGPELGGTAGPRITAVDILTGTAFQGNNTGQIDVGNNLANNPQAVIFNTSTSSGTVPLDAGPNHPIAFVTLSTVGLTSPNSWVFHGDVFGDPTKYFASGGASIVPTIIDGQLTVVPEPRGPIAVGALLAIGCCCRWLRRRGASGSGASVASSSRQASL